LRGQNCGGWFGGGGGNDRSCLLNNRSGLCFHLSLGLDLFSFHRSGLRDVFGFDVFDGLGSRNFLGKCRHNFGRWN
jgi:hypothetical protein